MADPIQYACTQCGADGVKLWRQYQGFLEDLELSCCSCGIADQSPSNLIPANLTPLDFDDRGMHPNEWGGRSDQIGWLVPAVPTKEGDTFWGYTSIPLDRYEWWWALPVTRAENG